MKFLHLRIYCINLIRKLKKITKKFEFMVTESLQCSDNYSLFFSFFFCEINAYLIVAVNSSKIKVENIIFVAVLDFVQKNRLKWKYHYLSLKYRDHLQWYSLYPETSIPDVLFPPPFLPSLIVIDKTSKMFVSLDFHTSKGVLYFSIKQWYLISLYNYLTWIFLKFVHCLFLVWNIC